MSWKADLVHRIFGHHFWEEVETVDAAGHVKKCEWECTYCGESGEFWV